MERPRWNRTFICGVVCGLGRRDTILPFEEFNKRCKEVFVTFDNGEEFHYIKVDQDGTVHIHMAERMIDETGVYWRHFFIEPDMTYRPAALDYLLGKRDNFSD